MKIYNWRHTKAQKQKWIKNKNQSKIIEVSEKKVPEKSAYQKPKEIVTCPHCGKTGGKPVMMRWHFSNCKQKKP